MLHLFGLLYNKHTRKYCNVFPYVLMAMYRLLIIPININVIIKCNHLKLTCIVIYN